MASNPNFSIVIPVYNGSNYLKEAIDSALGQTSKDVEVIVVNDGSNDGGQTEAIAKSYGDKIRYFYKENGGVASALNLGIKNMRGEWFAWLSHDDLFSNNRIEQDLILIDKNPEAKVTFCMIKLIDSQGEIIGDIQYPIEKVTNCYEALTYVDMCTTTIHKSCFEKVGLFNEFKKTTQDVEMTLRLSRVTPFYLNNKSITYKREHLNRGTYTLSEQHKKDLLDFCDLIHNEFSFNEFFPNLSDNEDEISNAWFYMGNLYYSWGAIHYAEECYSSAVLTHKNIFRRLIKRFNITVLKRENPVIKRLLKTLYFLISSK